jgi:hypothetical protein
MDETLSVQVETNNKKETLLKMERLYDIRIEKNVVVDGNNKSVTIRFDRDGNKHLYNDMLKRCDEQLNHEDLIKLDEYLTKSTFAEVSSLYKRRKDNIKEFLYFDVEINNINMQIQVGKRVWESGKNGKLRIKYIAYCIKKK